MASHRLSGAAVASGWSAARPSSAPGLVQQAEVSAATPVDAAADGADAAFDAEVPLGAIVFRPRNWLNTDGAPIPSDGTQRRFWVAPPQGTLSGGAARAAVPFFGGAPANVDSPSRSAPAGAGRPPQPEEPPAGASAPSFPGGAASSCVPASTGSNQAVAPPSPLESPRPTRPGRQTWSPLRNAESSRGTSTAERGSRPSSAGTRRPEQPASGRRPTTPRSNSRAGTPVAGRSRSVTPSAAPKRNASTGVGARPGTAGGSTGSAIASERRRGAQKGAPREQHEGRSGMLSSSSSRQNGRLSSDARSPSRADARSPSRGHSALESENTQLRAELCQLRAELRHAMSELEARDDIIREVSSHLASRNSSSSSSSIGNGLAEKSGAGVKQLEAVASRNSLIARLEADSSLIARLEADNERYRARIAEQDRLRVKLHPNLQTQPSDGEAPIGEGAYTIGHVAVTGSVQPQVIARTPRRAQPPRIV